METERRVEGWRNQDTYFLHLHMHNERERIERLREAVGSILERAGRHGQQFTPEAREAAIRQPVAGYLKNAWFVGRERKTFREEWEVDPAKMDIDWRELAEDLILEVREHLRYKAEQARPLPLAA